MRCSASVAIGDAWRQGVRRSGGAFGLSRWRGSHPLLGEHAIASIAIDPENALEAGKMGYRLGSLAVLAHDDAIGTGVDIDGTRPAFAWTERLL